MTAIESIHTVDARFRLRPGEGSDAVHRDPTYSYAVTNLQTSDGLQGTGLAFTLGAGNDLVCQAAAIIARDLPSKDIESLMANFGSWQRNASNEHQLRWLGPHKGVVHLALASVTNACWDLWAKSRGVPLWKLLLSLTPEQLLATLDLSYLEDVLDAELAMELLSDNLATRQARSKILEYGYPAYDTSVGWFHYDDETIAANCRRAIADGFTAMKLKVGSSDMASDIRRARIVRETAGPDVTLMVDANQQWSLPGALNFAEQTRDLHLFWIEEPTHPDDILGHQVISRAITPVKVAAGEHVPNRIVFKNYFQAGALGICQVDAVRVGGVSEFIVVSLLSRHYGIPVIPHVGDMGQIHQHLVLFNHIALGHEALFLEYIPHLSEHFTCPCRVVGGKYQTPNKPGMSSDLKPVDGEVG